MMKKTCTLSLSRIDKSGLFNKRISVSDLSSTDTSYLLDKLEELVHSIPITDLRYYLSDYIRGQDVLEDLVLSSELQTSRKDIDLGILDIAVNFVRNLDEVERYNDHVLDSNDDLSKKEYEGVIFDPVHGIMNNAIDSYLSPLDIEKDRDKVLHKSYILLRYQVSLSGSDFVLGYSVYDFNGRVIYYNEIHSDNLLGLVLRSIQEIWGHPEIEGNYRGLELIEGVQYLINGHKLSICDRDNKVPQFLDSHDKIKEEDTYLKIKKVSQVHSFLNTSLGSVLPILLNMVYVFSIILTIRFAAMDDYDIDLHYASSIGSGGLSSLISLIVEVFLKLPMLLCVFGIIITFILRKIVQQMDRHHSSYITRSKLL